MDPQPVVAPFLRLALLLALPLACADAVPQSERTGDVPDVQTPVPTSAAGWRFIPEMRVDGDREVLVPFSSVAVSGGGWFALPQFQDRAVRFFGLDATPLGALGRDGEGPGEFRRVNEMGWKADTLWVWDSMLRRITYISPQREFVRNQLVGSAAPRPADSPRLPSFAQPRPRAVYPDGSMLAEAAVTLAEAVRCPDCDGRSQLVRLSPDGHVDALIGSLPENDAMESAALSGGFGAVRIPFRADPLDGFAANGSRIAMAVAAVDDDAGTFGVTVLRATGDTAFARRYPFDPAPISRHLSDSVLAARIRSASYPELADALRKGTIPKVYNPLRRLLVGLDSTLWLELRSRPEQRQWLVLDSRGEPLDTVRLAPNLSLLAASLDALWVSETDELDVQSVVRFRIQRQ